MDREFVFAPTLHSERLTMTLYDAEHDAPYDLGYYGKPSLQSIPKSLASNCKGAYTEAGAMVGNHRRNTGEGSVLYRHSFREALLPIVGVI